MRTHIDRNTIRPYFNAGFLVMRPGHGLFQSWWGRFRELYRDPALEEHYRRNRLYAVFIHQAVLAGVILSTMARSQLHELPFAYNWPLHLYHDCPEELRPERISDLITVRYEQPEYLDHLPIQDPLKGWLEDRRRDMFRQ